MKSNDLKNLIQKRIKMILEQDSGVDQLIQQLAMVLPQVEDSQLSDEIKTAAATMLDLLGPQ